MIAPNPNSLCRQAELYYYDFLREESHELIPESIINHIEQCQHCRERINQLKVSLSQAAGLEPGQKQVSSAITTMLKLHFAYVGQHVTCETVRPLLPSLADPALEVSVPTPITVHLDKCQQCANDIETIRQLTLTHKQLCRLGQLFAEESTVDAKFCAKAQSVIPSVVSMVFHMTNAKVLKHLCTCPNCRELIYQRRRMVQRGLLRSKMAQDQFPCEKVSATDIFDYCFPYGIDPVTDQYAKFRPAFTSHITTCPMCLAKMQRLHEAVYAIAERADSGIVTVYHVDESAKAAEPPESDALYAGFPIRVEVTGREDEVKAERPDSTIDFTAALKRKVSAMNLKPLFKTVVAAAVVMLIVVAIFFSTPTAKAVTIGRIYKAFERIKNVCLTTFAPEVSKPAREIWISQTLNVKMFKTETQYVLWDIKGKSRKTRDLNTGSIRAVEPSEDVLTRVEETMKTPWGVLPFENVSTVPEDAVWQQAADENIETTIPNTEVYDLMWMEKELDGSVLYKKWRGYIDIETKLPRRVERWRKHTKEEEYKLLTVMKVTYPATSEIQAVIEDAGF